MKIVLLPILLLRTVTSVLAEPRSWLCRSIDGVGMSFDKENWKKSDNLEAVMFEAKETPDGSHLKFPDWLQMGDANCTRNPDVPWISCANGFTLFTLNQTTGDAVMASIGLWVLKEKMNSAGLPSPPLGADVQILRCQ